MSPHIYYFFLISPNFPITYLNQFPWSNLTLCSKGQVVMKETEQDGKGKNKKVREGKQDRAARSSISELGAGFIYGEGLNVWLFLDLEGFSPTCIEEYVEEELN